MQILNKCEFEQECEFWKNLIFGIRKINVGNVVKWDIYGDFQTLCYFLKLENIFFFVISGQIGNGETGRRIRGTSLL